MDEQEYEKNQWAQDNQEFLTVKSVWTVVKHYIRGIDQEWCQDDWILAKFLDFNKNRKNERCQNPVILTEQAWSIKNLLYGQDENFFLRDQRGKSLHAGVANQNERFASSCPLADSV